MRFIRVAILGLSLFGSAYLHAAISDSDLQTLINRVKFEYDFIPQEIKPLSAEKGMLRNSRKVEAGFLTQVQADLLNQEGFYLIVDRDDGDIFLLATSEYIYEHAGEQ